MRVLSLGGGGSAVKLMSPFLPLEAKTADIALEYSICGGDSVLSRAICCGVASARRALPASLRLSGRAVFLHNFRLLHGDGADGAVFAGL